MIASLLTAVWLLAGDAPVPARVPGDPPAPALATVPDRGEQIPAPLPQRVEPAPAGIQFTPQQLRRDPDAFVRRVERAYLALRRRGGRPDVIAKDRHHLGVA